MKFIVVVPALAVRKEASNRAELINQILFGESIEIIEQYKEWAFVRTLHDDYRGWVDNKSFYFNDIPLTNSINIIASFCAKVAFQGKTIQIPFGSFFTASKDDLLEGKIVTTCKLETALELVISQLLGTPYLWGGRTGFGIDCSGLTQLFYRMMDINLPRDSVMQAEIGDDIFLTQANSGDLLFYKNSENKIVHVGIAIDENHILHASGNSRIDKFDSNGIFNHDLKIYTHTFAFAKRIIKPL